MTTSDGGGVPCNFACVAFLSNAFSLAGGVGVSGEIGRTGAGDVVERLVLTPAVVFSVNSVRNQVSVGYGPTLTRVFFPTRQTNTFVQRLNLSLRRSLTPNTAIAINGGLISGRFDVSGMQTQLDTTNSIPVDTVVTYRSATASLALNTSLSKRWTLTTTANGQYNDTPQIGGTGNVVSYQTGLGSTASYAWIPGQSLQFTVNAGRIDRIASGAVASDQTLLTLTGQVGTSRAFSLTDTGAIGIGYSSSQDWPHANNGTPQGSKGAVVSGTYSKQLPGGQSPVTLSLGLNWSPSYDPFTDRVRSIAAASLMANWRPTPDWTTTANLGLSTSTDKRPVPAQSNNDPTPETRISFTTPISYRLNRWAAINFGGRVNLPAPHLSLKFKLLRPDYWAFGGVRFQTP